MKRVFKNLLGNRILVEQAKVKKVGVILLADESVEKAQSAKVLLTGPDCEVVKVGDEIVFDKFAGEVLEDDDEHTLTLATEDDVYGVLEDE